MKLQVPLIDRGARELSNTPLIDLIIRLEHKIQQKTHLCTRRFEDLDGACFDGAAAIFLLSITSVPDAPGPRPMHLNWPHKKNANLHVGGFDTRRVLSSLKTSAMTTNTISSTPSSGGGKKSTSSTTAMATVKWDDQTANRFASLRTSLQHALIDSTLPLPAATTKKGADSPFSPTRASATISAHYGRSHSESAALNSAAKVEMPSLRQNSGGGGNNYNSSLLPAPSNNNNSSAASSKQRTMISPSNNVTNGGVNAGVFPFARSKSSPLPPVVDNQQTKSNQNQLQQQPLLGRSISYSNNVNSNDGNIKIEEDDGLATMLATPPNNNHHYQYHVNAIRALLSDTPLPLAISTPSDSSTNNSNDDINDNANRSNNSSSSREGGSNNTQ
mmetsp:Transcript_5573/g.8278  ORF Transcript_5573/g.8278 Transcript_5573/m.8278 type:complete len:387 (+) Transcript_5573:2-1162(+)